MIFNKSTVFSGKGPEFKPARSTDFLLLTGQNLDPFPENTVYNRRVFLVEVASTFDLAERYVQLR